MKKMLIIILILLIIIDVYFEVNFPKINEVLIETKKVKEEIRIIQISDLHNKRLGDGFFDKVEKEKPDFIVLTGDLIDKKTKDYSNVYYFVEQLIKINVPVCYVSGNHELSHKDVNIFEQEISKRGVILLDEDNIIYKEINIYGFGYYSNFKNIEIDDDVFSLGLAHNPMDAKDINFDLILSGHTHGGQVRLPFIGAIFIPGQGFFAKYDKGLFDINSETKLYIDSGIGNTFLPIRFLNRSQFSLIKIYSK
ncbi:MAG: metallophosphoesterase [Candidatus Pacebacteria bacterium]|nr:metallophosphoesterase [Candidatus Paceibacterota bacterium]